MNIEAIHQNAKITSTSVCGQYYNRVSISYDEYDFLTELTGKDNQYKGYGVDLIEMDYHGEFIPLIEAAHLAEEQQEIEREGIRAWKAANKMFEDEEDNYYHG